MFCRLKPGLSRSRSFLSVGRKGKSKRELLDREEKDPWEARSQMGKGRKIDGVS